MYFNFTPFCFALIVCAQLAAQPVIQHSDYIGPGTQLEYSSPAPGWSLPFDLNPAGAQIVWDMTSMPLATSTPEVYSSIEPLAFFYQVVFNSPFSPESQATHYREIPILDLDPGLQLPLEFSDVFEFFRNEPDGYFQVGNSVSLSGFPLITDFTHNDRIYKFPLAYGQFDTSYVEFLTEIPAVATFAQSGWRYNHTDAWGTLLTPYGSFEVIRVRSERLLTDSISIPESGFNEVIERPLQVDYSWLSPSFEAELLRISTVGGQVISIAMANTALSSSSSAPLSEAMKVWPNPAAGSVWFSLPFSGNVEVRDIAGRLWRSTYLRKGQHQMDAQLLPAGWYIFTLSDGSRREHMRIVLSH